MPAEELDLILSTTASESLPEKISESLVLLGVPKLESETLRRHIEQYARRRYQLLPVLVPSNKAGSDLDSCNEITLEMSIR
jgi:hypothetical protein